MRSLIIQSCDERYAPLADITVPMVKAHAGLAGWNHEFIPVKTTDGQTAMRDYNYRKYELIGNALSNNDQVMWMDVDIIPARQALYPVFDSHDVYVSVDQWGWCSGAMLFNRTEWAAWLVEVLLRIIPPMGRFHMEEQQTFSRLIGFHRINERVVAMPESFVANPTSDQSLKPTFLHLWANTGLGECIERARTYATLRLAV